MVSSAAAQTCASSSSSAAIDGGILGLIVDEAQSVPFELLEELRLLTNAEGNSGRALTLVLVGQPELSARLEDATLRQLKQRVALRTELRPFGLKETAGYIAARITIAGGRADALFTRDAVIAIHDGARGLPRTISVICDNALVSGFASDVKPVGRELVLEVCRDFELGEKPPDAPEAQPRARQGPAGRARSSAAFRSPAGRARPSRGGSTFPTGSTPGPPSR